MITGEHKTYIQLIMSTLGKRKEQRYRQQFEKPFDFLTFNKVLILSSGSGRYAIAFDPSYISKAGKKTPGVNWYWSACANQAKWGLEIRGLAAIDIDNHIAFHLEAVQTHKTDEQSLTNWYAGVISARKDTLTAISKYMVADAWFSKKVFVDPIVSMRLHLISRMRDDTDLRYISAEKPTDKRGRPRKYAGKIIINDIDTAFSMSDIKTMNHNTILLQRFIDVFGITLYSIKNQKYFKELIFYSTMAA
jgi:hypothetical protein